MTINQRTLASKMKSALKAKGGNEITIEGCEIWGPGVFDITYNTDDEMPAFYTYCKDMDTMGRGHSIWEAIEEMFCADDEIRNEFKKNNEEITVPDSEFEKLKSLLNETDEGVISEIRSVLESMDDADDFGASSYAIDLADILKRYKNNPARLTSEIDHLCYALEDDGYNEYSEPLWDAIALLRQKIN